MLRIKSVHEVITKIKILIKTQLSDIETFYHIQAIARHISSGCSARNEYRENPGHICRLSMEKLS